MKVSKKYLVLTCIIVILAIAINVYIIVHACLNGSDSSKASQGIVDVSKDVINTVAPGTVTESNYPSFATFIRKALGHFGLFMINGILSPWAIYLALNPLKSSRYWILITYALEFGLLIALITETIQLNVAGRSGELRDVLIDYGGYFLGFSIIFFILLPISIKKYKKRQA